MAQCGDILPANRPDPDDPGGLGAEESETERTGPTQDLFVATHEGARWAEVGPYYDFANDRVTTELAIGCPGEKDPRQIICRGQFSRAGPLRWPAVGAIM